MGQSTKALVQFVVISAGIASLLLWLVVTKPDATVWEWRAGLLPVVAAGGYLLWRASRRKDIIPDRLAQMPGIRFERDGLLFMPLFDVQNGIWRLSLFFQNRYGGRCESTIFLWPPKKSFGLGRVALPKLQFRVACAGGAFGVQRIYLPIPAKFQGQQVSFEFFAKTRYPSGSGTMLLTREGMRVAGPGGWATLGVSVYKRSAGFSMQLPTRVADTEINLPPPETEILWEPTLPTHGFPVGPAKDLTSPKP